MEFAELIETGTGHKVGFEPITICPLGDVHYGAETCALERFKEHLAWTQTFPNPWYLGMGDLFDALSPSNLRNWLAALAKEELYDTPQAMMEDANNAKVLELAEILSSTRGRWLGMLDGDHKFVFKNGTTSDMRLCAELDSPFLGASTIIKVLFEDKSRHRQTLHVWAHHGRGSGIYQSSPLNILQQLAAHFEGIDVFLMGHQHKETAGRLTRVRPQFIGTGQRAKTVRRLARGAGLAERDVVIAGTGNFLRAYTEGTPEKDEHGQDIRPRATYIERQMKPPLPLGAPIIHVDPQRQHDGRVTLKVRVTS